MLATPVKGGVEIPYLGGLVGTLKHLHDADYVPAVCAATYVNVGRNDLVEQARREGCAEIIFIDSDMGWTDGDLLRLRSHAVDIVAGCYPKRKAGGPHWTFHPKPGEKPNENGLIECNSVPAGFLRVKMKVFDQIQALTPRSLFKDHGRDGVRCEFFPIGLVGPGTAEGRLRAILRRLSEDGCLGLGKSELMAIIGRNDLPDSVLEGEDYGFCRLAREVGFKIWADTAISLRHYGEIGYPAQQLPL